MKILLEKIIKTCLERGISVELVLKGEEISYKIEGFSKTGTAHLYIEDDAIICETRYGRKDHILSFKDLVFVAFEWYENYKCEIPFEKPDESWTETCKKYNLIESSEDDEYLSF